MSNIICLNDKIKTQPYWFSNLWKSILKENSEFLERRFDLVLEYKTIDDLGKISVTTKKMLIRNKAAKQIIFGNHLILPLTVDCELFGAFIVHNCFSKTKEDVEEIIKFLLDVVLNEFYPIVSKISKTILANSENETDENGDVNGTSSYSNHNNSNNGNSNNGNSNNDNINRSISTSILPFRPVNSFITNKAIANSQNSYHLYNEYYDDSKENEKYINRCGHILINHSDLDQIRSIAIDLNQEYLKRHFVSIDYFKNHLLFQQDFLNNLHNVCIFIPEIMDLNYDQFQSLCQYLRQNLKQNLIQKDQFTQCTESLPVLFFVCSKFPIAYIIKNSHLDRQSLFKITRHFIRFHKDCPKELAIEAILASFRRQKEKEQLFF